MASVASVSPPHVLGTPFQVLGVSGHPRTVSTGPGARGIRLRVPPTRGVVLCLGPGARHDVGPGPGRRRTPGVSDRDGVLEGDVGVRRKDLRGRGAGGVTRVFTQPRHGTGTDTGHRGGGPGSRFDYGLHPEFA